MRVLQIVHTEERGGIQTLASMIEEGLAGHGFRVDTEYLYSRPNLGSLAKLRAALRMAFRLLRNDHDAIIAYQATASVLTGWCGWLNGCRRRIVHQTATPAETAWMPRLADRVTGTLGLYTTNIANTAFTLGEFRNYPAPYRRRMVLIEHGLDKPVSFQERAGTRVRFHLPRDSALILNVGRLTAQKNQGVLIDALAELRDAALVVAGHGPDEQALRARADARGVGGRVHLLGAVTPDDVADLYAACDVFAFPSTWETFGLAAAEAAMTGIPMIVSDIRVLHEVLASAASPVTFASPDDAQAWVDALRRLLSLPPARERRAAFAREIGARYARERMIKHYVDLLWNGTVGDTGRVEDGGPVSERHMAVAGGGRR